MPKTGILVLLTAMDEDLSGLAATADELTGSQISNAMKAADFKGKKDSKLIIPAPANTKLSHIVLYGAGESDKLDEYKLELVGGGIAGVLNELKAESAKISASLEAQHIATADICALIASGMALRSYSFDKYKTGKEDDKTEKLTSVSILCGNPAKAKTAFAPLQAIASGVHLARDLVNEPSNILTPKEFARRAKSLTSLGLEVEVLSEKKMHELGMGSLLGVGQGSQNRSRLAIMRWNGGKAKDKPVAFVGKGVTFDSGGISLKPGNGMWDMKGDMGGAACVTGLMAALAGRGAKVNAVGVIGLVENMPDGKAQRPGDVVTSMSGQTIAVLNTDAEGRLVLADALWYTQDRFEPKFMVNLATLTGAILVALGKEHAGLFSNDDELAEQLHATGNKTGEKVWRLPLDKAYDKLIDSDIADMKNIGGRYAGSITAAQFLKRFVNDTPWAHLDIAGTAMDSPKTAICKSWGSGWGVRLLSKLVADHYED